MPHVFQPIDLIWVQQLDITIWEERERHSSLQAYIARHKRRRSYSTELHPASSTS
jgi:hypothetical protein